MPFLLQLRSVIGRICQGSLLWLALIRKRDTAGEWFPRLITGRANMVFVRPCQFHTRGGLQNKQKSRESRKQFFCPRILQLTKKALPIFWLLLKIFQIR